MHKICTNCKLEKNVKDFPSERKKYGNVYIRSVCRVCRVDSQRFKNGKVNWENVYKNLKRNISNRKGRKSGLSICSKDEFIQWAKKKIYKCSFCKMDIDQSIKILEFYKNYNYLSQNLRKQDRFQIDKKDPNKGYYPNNMDIACYICNSHKKDLFSHEEFKKIGKEILEKKFLNILNFNEKRNNQNS